MQNTLTHELGHLMGLEHPCRVGADPPRTDGNGVQVPMCGAALNDAQITEATMFNFQDCGETKKETLEPRRHRRGLRDLSDGRGSGVVRSGGRQLRVLQRR